MKYFLGTRMFALSSIKNKDDVHLQEWTDNHIVREIEFGVQMSFKGSISIYINNVYKNMVDKFHIKEVTDDI